MSKARQVELLENHAAPPSHAIILRIHARDSERSEESLLDSFVGRPTLHVGWWVFSSLRLRHNAQIRPRRVPSIWIYLLGLFFANRRKDDHVIVGFPAHWRSHLVLGGELHRIHHPHHFTQVPASAHRISD